MPVSFLCNSNAAMYGCVSPSGTSSLIINGLTSSHQVSYAASLVLAISGCRLIRFLDSPGSSFPFYSSLLFTSRHASLRTAKRVYLALSGVFDGARRPFLADTPFLPHRPL